MIWLCRLAVVLAFTWLSLPAAAQEVADLVLHNGVVATLDDARPAAHAIAVRAGRIVLVGTDAQVKALAGPDTRVIDLAGRFAMPGFIEGHGHFMSLGRSKLSLDLSTAKNWDEVVARVAQAVEKAKPGEWITGRGWHQEKWDPAPVDTVDGVPTHHALSRVSPDNPVSLSHASGHAGFVNAKAMELAGITRETKDPPGGAIVRDADGEPTGYLRETAAGLVSRARGRSDEARTPAERDAENRKIVTLAANEALAHGVTTFHDAGSPFATIDLFKTLADEGALPLRLYVMVRDDNRELAEKLPRYRMIGYGNGFLTVRAIKRSIDGALGSHGAWLLEPYADLPDSSGGSTTTPESMRRTAELAMANDFQLCTHAIGDRANRETLDLYASLFAANAQKRDLRWRIEHAQHVTPADLPRFRELGVIASMQGIHATSDGPWIVKRLGERRARDESYLWRAFLDAGVVVTNGTDCPVEPIDTIACYYASVTRRPPGGEAIFPEQRMSRLEALRSYTLSNAYAGFEEEQKGSLEVGKLADIVVLSQDLLTVPQEQIRQTTVEMTIVGGKVAYQR